MKRIIGLLLCVCLTALSLSLSISALSYTYDLKEEAQPMPEAVTVSAYVDAAYAGVPHAIDPSDIAADEEGRLYVTDAEHNSVVILDEKFHFYSEISTLYAADGSVEALAAPQGIYVDAAGLIYIADRDNHRVVVCDAAGGIARILTAAGEQVYIDGFEFNPRKVAADRWGNVYVLAEGVYDGLLQFDTDDRFVGFVGSNEVSPNLLDVLWKKIATRAQREQYAKTVPVEFDNIDVDQDGFIYTVTASISNDPQSISPVRKQTAKGTDILKTGRLFGKAIGDLEFPVTWDTKASVRGSSAFVDVSASQDYGFSCLDGNHGRVFVYSTESELLFAFGGIGTVVGCFQKPSAITSYDDQIMVLDSTTRCITVFRFTDYGRGILRAQQLYIDGEYEASSAEWEEVLSVNSGLLIAYSGLAKTYVMRGDFGLAMHYAKLGGDQETYSKAFEFYRQDFLNRNFGWLLLGIAVIAVFTFLAVRLFKKTPLYAALCGCKPVRGLTYGGYIMTHPFKGFWDMIHEKRGNALSCGILYALFALTVVLQRQGTAFLYTDVTKNFNLLSALLSAIVPVFLWCVCNWAISTLMDGDGKPGDIAMGTAYALLPYILFNLTAVLLTYVLSAEESIFITVLGLFAAVWTGFLLLVSTITVHDFTLPRAIGTIIITILGIMIVIFLVLLAFNLVQQMVYFLIGVYQQIVIRL